LILVVITGVFSNRSLPCSHGSRSPANTSTCSWWKTARRRAASSSRSSPPRGAWTSLSAKGRVETLIRSPSRFSRQAILIITGKSDVSLAARKIGPALIFERLWKQTGIGQAIRKQAAERKFGFDVERAVFSTVLHRLMVSGSDRFCDRWHQDYAIDGVDGIELQHLYRAMDFLGEELADQTPATAFVR